MAYGQINADQISTSVSGYSLGAGNSSLLKNKIINGSMVIDQRNAGASGTASNYTVDRWVYSASQASKGTWQQNAGSVTPPVGFSNYLGFTSSSAYSVGATDYFSWYQPIEGYNTADLSWGTANGKTITISAWVYSSLTGTFGGAISNSAYNYFYPFSYTISSANTWTQISVTIAAPPNGSAWVTNNGIGIRVNFSLGTGSTYSNTAGTWTTSVSVSCTGATSVVGTNGATFYITGVQLEVGSSATGFEYRQYGTELSLCQRYYEKSYDVTTVPATSTESMAVFFGGIQGTSTTGYIIGGAQFKVTKRANPTMVYYDTVGNSGKCNRHLPGSYLNANQNATNYQTATNNIAMYSSSGDAASGVVFHFTASSEL